MRLPPWLLTVALAAPLITLACEGAGDAADPASSQDATDAGADADTAEHRPLAFCEGATVFAWDPGASSILTAFPDDTWTRDDEDAWTGLRVALGDAPFLADAPDVLRPIFEDLEALDGWGTSAGAFLRFQGALGAVPSGAADSVTSDAVMLVAVEGGVATRVPFEAQLVDDDQTLIVWPMRPLAPKTLHALIVTTAQPAADGGCVAPSAPLRALLTGAATAPQVARLGGRIEAVLTSTGLAPDAISAITVFTTQAIHDASLAAAGDIAARDYAWSRPPTCEPQADYVACTGAFTAWDYRDEGYLGDPITPTPYELPVRVWLPREGPGPFPVVLYGHGLGGDGDQGRLLARVLAPRGFAVAAMSTLRHGDHPTARAGDPNAFALDLFGIDLQSFTIRGLVFRENLRQAALDKLQLIALLRTDADLDGDGADDLDMEHLGYWGLSLGGIMASDLLALTDAVDAAVLSVAGGRLISVITDGADMAGLRDLLAALIGGDDAIARLAPVAQTLIDAGDPVNYAPHVFGDRLDAAAVGSHVLLAVAVDDTVVPNVTSHALARALGLPHVAPHVTEVDGLADAGPAPVSANLPGGRTGGFFQLDRTSFAPGGSPLPATHNNVFSGIEGPSQGSFFLETWLSGPAPVITDPYADFGTPPLPR